MALVAYSDSEGSDVEPEPVPVLATDKPRKADSSSGFHVDRSNPRKIRVALPELKSEQPTDQDSEDGPARKKARIGGGSGGAFSGFNALLPAPKRAAEKKASVTSTRKVFSLKTGATPGFDRDADAEMRNDQELNEGAGHDGGVDPAASSFAQPAAKPDGPKTEAGEVKLQGNPMMFRPLSVARTQKKKPKAAAQPTPSLSASTLNPSEPAAQQPTPKAPAPTPPKPKVSLFSLSSTDTSSHSDTASATTTYEPLVYNTENETPSAGPAPAPDSLPAVEEHRSSQTVSSSLDHIASDLNLSKSERRQLFGRNAPSAESRILEFNTDKEYAMNQVRAETELAATQHNPVRAIAPGKHTLQQLVSAANSQKDALEESFATGRRNKKEAGSKYGW